MQNRDCLKMIKVINQQSEYFIEYINTVFVTKHFIITNVFQKFKFQLTSSKVIKLVKFSDDRNTTINQFRPSISKYGFERAPTSQIQIYLLTQ